MLTPWVAIDPVRISDHGPHPWPGDFDGDGKPDLVACVEWSVYPFYRHAALMMKQRPEFTWTAPLFFAIGLLMFGLSVSGPHPACLGGASDFALTGGPRAEALFSPPAAKRRAGRGVFSFCAPL